MGLFRRTKKSGGDTAATPPAPLADPPAGPLLGVMLSPSELDSLRADVDAAKASAAAAVGQATAALASAEQASTRAGSVEQASQGYVTVERLTQLVTELERLAQLVNTSVAESRQARELASVVDMRVTQLGTELANQIDELSGEMEAVQQRTAEVLVIPQSIDDLRTNQVRLASEQARYEIAFRQDLAELADEVLKRSR